MWKLANKDATLTIDYTVDGEFVTPSSAEYTVLRADGTVVASGTLPAQSTTEPLVLLAVNNTVSGEYDTQFVRIDFVFDGREYSQQSTVYFSAFIPLTATAGQVRGALGLDRVELPDESVGIYEAYFNLRWSEGEAFKAALISGGRIAQAANEAVVLRAALDICGSIEMRTHIYVKSEDSLVQRSTKIDFDKLAQSLESKLADRINLATGVTVNETVLFALSTPADPFTG